MVAAPTPVEIFCSYAREDEAWLRKLEIHLSLLQRQGLISLWYDRLISPGTDWAKTIDTHLETASVILLLVSADFFASDYCYGIEMQRALERETAGEARVIPILVRPADWTDAPFAYLQALPTDAKPVVSWRNKDTALTDVVAGIRRVIVEELPQLTASAPRAALPKIWNIPYPRNPFFLGREIELTQIRQNLQTGQATALSQPQAISGLGGIGKTQLALEYAYRYHQDYTAILWVRAESTEALVSSYIALAAVLKLSERDAQEQEIIIQAVKVWLETHRRWLLIFDNADELALIPAFLPAAWRGHLLLTTRAQAMGRLAHRIEVDAFSPEAGALFLLRRAALIAPDVSFEHLRVEDRQLALQVTQELGRLPLALDQAGAYLEETGSSLSDYQQMYQQYRGALLKERRGLVRDHPEPVATTWLLSFERVGQRSAAAVDLLRLCAFLAPDAIPGELLTHGAPFLGPVLGPVASEHFLLDRAFEALRAFSLISRDPRTHTMSVHRLVQAVLRDDMNISTQQAWAERAIRVVHATLPSVEYGNWSQWERLVVHAHICAQHIERNGSDFSEAVEMLQQTGWYLTERARYDEAEHLLEQAYAISEQKQGSEHLDTAKVALKLANLYRGQGKYEQAEPLYQQVLAIRERQLGTEHPDTAESLDSLASIYHAQGKYEQAEPLLEQALAISKQKLGAGHPDTAAYLNNLANLYRTQGKYEQAEPLLEQALPVYERQLGAEHPDTASCLNNLAGLYRKQGKYEQAEPLFQQALVVSEQQLGSEHPDTATCLNNLALLYRDQGKYEQAEPLFQQALEVYERQLGVRHPLTVIVRRNYASLLRAMGRDGEVSLLETNEDRP